MLALCMTVKNEEKLLAQNLRYHRAAGVDAFYIFDDGSTDGTVASVRSMPDVTISSSVDPALFLDHPDFSRVVARAHELITARQVLNSHTAFQHAKAAGHQWMISLDADELLYLEDGRGIEGSLTRFFNTVRPEIDTILFKPAELIPCRMEAKNPFAENSFFHTIPRRNGREIHDPYSDKPQSINSFIGHAMGKSAARIRDHILHKTVHTFTSSDGRELNRFEARWLLHYNIHSFGNFIQKYQRFHGHPETYLTGAKIEIPRSLWIRMVNDSHFDRDFLLDYYQRWVASDATGEDGVRQFEEVSDFFRGCLKNAKTQRISCSTQRT